MGNMDDYGPPFVGAIVALIATALLVGCCVGVLIWSGVTALLGG